jgi:hypothetical protein
MKRRVRKIANFFAFNLLFFALYLNFVHKDKLASVNNATVQTTAAAAFSGTVRVENPAEYLTQQRQGTTPAVAAPTTKTEQNEGTALKLSIN